MRELQHRKHLATLIKQVENESVLFGMKRFVQVKRTRDELSWDASGPPPIFVKISPDLSKSDLENIARIAMDGGFDGLIVSNTTTARPGYVFCTHLTFSVDSGVQDSPGSVGSENGGLSGPPLFDLSTKVLSEMYILTKGSVPIIGCGGISNGKQAYAKIRAGSANSSL